MERAVPRDANFEPIVGGAAGFTLGIEPWAPRHQMRWPHWHDGVEVNFVRRGHGEYRIGDQVLPIERHTVFVIPPGVPHQSVGTPSDPHWHLTLSFQPDALAPLGRMGSRWARWASATVRHVQAEAYADMWEHLIEGLLRQLRHDTPADTPLAAARLLEACFLAARCERSSEEEQPDLAPAAMPPHPARVHVDHMKRFVDDHFHQSITLADIAEHAGINPSYGSAIFRRHTGMRLFAYVSERRLAHARTLLSGSALTVAEVAAACGFSHVPTFYRQFEAAWGTTPVRFRRSDALPVTDAPAFVYT